MTIWKGADSSGLVRLYSRPLVIPGYSDFSLSGFDQVGQIHSRDFSRVLGSASPPGSASRHIIELDLVTGSHRDLTQPRVTTGFTGSDLCEDGAGYLPRIAPTLSGGSDVVGFFGRPGARGAAASGCFGGLSSLSLANPSNATTLANRPAVESARDASEDGQFYWDIFAFNSNSNNSIGFVRADGGQKVPVNCLTDARSDPTTNQRPLGWVGPRSVAVGLGGNASGAGSGFRVATLNADGTVSCTDGIPPTSKTIRSIYLSFDSQAVLFEADGGSGFQRYRQTLGSANPTLTAYADPAVYLDPTVERGRFVASQVGP